MSENAIYYGQVLVALLASAGLAFIGREIVRFHRRGLERVRKGGKNG